jgi:hypothetical protein
MVVYLQNPTPNKKVEELPFWVIELLNISDIRQIEAHTAEQLIPGASHTEVEIAIAKLKS